MTLGQIFCRCRRVPFDGLSGPWVAVLVLALVCSWIALVGGPAAVQAQTKSPVTEDDAATAADEHPFSFRIKSPPLDGGQWVNTAAPLSLDDLRGRFVLLDFWTYCCINCMHVLPELKKLEHAFPNELVVVGVHSAKFEGEQVTENIREAALRYEIEHPVVNDAEMTIWRRFGARSWPTLVLIDPAGEVVWAANGERSFDDIKTVIDHGLPYYKAQGLLKPAPRPAIIGFEKKADTPLRFPGKVLADKASGRLFIADSNHNRIIVAKIDGQVQHVVGSGQIGRVDGAFDTCSFNHPQGMALIGEALYVADTENHLLRKVDPAAVQVTTVAGTGEKGGARFRIADFGLRINESNPQSEIRNPQSKPTKVPLASPWALWHHGNDLYIAMAGPHQIWRMSLNESTIGAFAGNGREDIVDGPLLPDVPYQLGFSSFAQPSGLTSDGTHLFVADSEGSTVRSVPFDANGKVQTLVGLTGTLFDFGDTDGKGSDVRLQHPLGVAWSNGTLYVADSYNNKIKAIDVAQRTCRTIAGSGEAGNRDADAGGKATFNEPGGISAAGGKVYVADTNNHAIRVVELAAPHRVSTLQLQGLTPPPAR
ncbi:MAG: redoxin domain-containing protein [Planctomycetes bacterium]|nr:redoxin domain-containing protein [Planctomycetota bacterium]